MRDEYGRITPDFEAWEKLGYHFVDIHAETYTLTDSNNPYDFINIVAEYAPYCTENGLPEYTKEHFMYPNSRLEPFTIDELEQIKKDIDNFKNEMKNNNR